jgi:predicted AAA+ superfamily ATPase
MIYYLLILLQIPNLNNKKDHDNVVKFYYNENKQHPILFPIPNDQIQDLMRIIGTRAHRKQLNNSANNSMLVRG